MPLHIIPTSFEKPSFDRHDRQQVGKHEFLLKMANSYVYLAVQLMCVLSASLSVFSLPMEQGDLMIDPEVLPYPVTTPGPDKYANWTDWEDWTPAQDVLKAFPWYRMGYDNDGLVGRFSSPWVRSCCKLICSISVCCSLY